MSSSVFSTSPCSIWKLRAHSTVPCELSSAEKAQPTFKSYYTIPRQVSNPGTALNPVLSLLQSIIPGRAASHAMRSLPFLTSECSGGDAAKHSPPH